MLHAIGCILAATAPAQPVQWHPDEGGNGHWYKPVAVPTLLNWVQADQLARDAGGYLATILSEDENLFVFELINDPEFWFVDQFGFMRGPMLGGVQDPDGQEPDGGWGWITDEPFSYEAWAPGQPNDAGSEQDTIQYWNADVIFASWQDSGRFGEQLAYVIEWDECPCEADLTGDCELTIIDFVAFQNAWLLQKPEGDCDANGVYNILDYVCYQQMFLAGCP